MSHVPFRGELILYRTEDWRNVVQLRVVDGTVWPTQAEIAELFDTSESNSGLRLENLASRSGRDSVVKESLTTDIDQDASDLVGSLLRPLRAPEGQLVRIAYKFDRSPSSNWPPSEPVTGRRLNA